MAQSRSPIRSVAVLGHNAIAESITTCLSNKCKVYKLAQRSYASPHIKSARNDAPEEMDVDLSSSASIADTLIKLVPMPDLLILTVHGGNYDLQRRIILGAHQAGITRIMPAEFGFDSTDTLVQERLPPHKERAKVLELLRDHEDDLSWVGVATGYAIESRLGHGNLGIDIKWQSATVYGSGEEQFAISSDAFVGRAVRAIIDRWEEVQNRYLCLSSLRTCLKDILQSLEGQVETDFATVHVEQDKCIEEAEKRMQGGWPDAGMFLAERSLLCNVEAWSGYERDKCLTEMLGLEMDTLDDLIHGVVHKSKHRKGDCGCD